MSGKKYIIINNIDELKLIEKLYPDLRHSPLILLSGAFSFGQLEQFQGRGFCYMDDLIDPDSYRSMADIVHHIQWNWYKDEKGEDLSLIDGLSIGVTFQSSVEILLNTILKYEFGLSRILSSKDEVYYVDDAFGIIIKDLSNKLGCMSYPIRPDASRPRLIFSANKIIFDEGFRFRDLAPYFRVKRIHNLFYCFLRALRKVFSKYYEQETVLLLPAGKLDQFIEERSRTNGVAGFSWVLPLSLRKDFPAILSKRLSPFFRYVFFSSTDRMDRQIKELLAKLETNILERGWGISNNALLQIMKVYVFKHVPAAVSFYRNALKEIGSLSPKLVAIGAEGFETHCIVAQASRHLNIKTAFLPHGTDDWQSKELRCGKEKIFDYVFAFGQKHVLDSLDAGMSAERVVVTSFPYFSDFLPIPLKKSVEQYKKALILTQDFSNVSPASKYRDFFDHLRNVAGLLKEMHIGIAGIKARHALEFRFYDMKEDFLVLNGQEVPLFFGYSSFPEVAAKADLVIGGFGTALMEATLMGIDYYVVGSKYDALIHSVSGTLEKMMYVSHSIDELRENIRNKRIFRPGYSAKDFVDLEGVGAKDDLYKKFENTISEVVYTC